MRRRDPDNLAALDRAIIKLSPGDFRGFVRQLDDPPKPNKALIELLRRKPIWER
jgi:uncharacterized protein (DUF1778 family)